MPIRFWREKIIAIVCCLVGIAACVVMWYEAELHTGKRPLRLFGGPRSTPFFENKFPEATITFSGIGFVCLLLSVLGLVGRQEKIPDWMHGVGLIVVAGILGLFLVQARWINGFPLTVIQPGFYLAMLAVSGLAWAGIIVLIRSFKRK